MKNISKLLSISFILLLRFVNLTAGVDNSFSVTTDENNYLVVNIDKVSQEKLEVILKDKLGREIFSEKISANKISRRKYDINDINDGVYTLLLELDNEVKVQKIKKNNNNVVVYPEDKFSIYKPTILEENGIVSVSMLLFHGNFEVKIYDQDGNILLKEMHNAEGAFNSRYNLTTLPEGDYSFSIEVEQGSYDGSFNKNVIINSAIASL